MAANTWAEHAGTTLDQQLDFWEIACTNGIIELPIEIHFARYDVRPSLGRDTEQNEILTAIFSVLER
jgi:hypothetical protein